MKFLALALMIPIAALADDITGTATLFFGSANANTSLNLDTGKAVTSGGDILWTGDSIAPVGNAKLKNLGLLFSVQPPSYYVDQAATATATPIPASKLTSGDQFVVLTNGGSTAKVSVTGILTVGTVVRITLSFTTYVGAAPGTPLITDILNNSSNTPSDYPSYGIAPSSIFVVKGSFLADPGDPVLQNTLAGLPSSLNGASITVTVNGTTVHPALYYTSPGQLAAELPASTPSGDGTVTVTYNGKTSPPSAIHVVPAALGINTYGGNVGVATDASTGALLTYSSSGHPGQTLTLWATGLGADAGDSDTHFSSAPQRVNTSLQIYIGNDPVNILYQGSSGYPGVNQINITIPENSITGCFVPLNAIAGGVPSNTVLLPIAPNGGPCSDPVSGWNGNQLPVFSTQTLKAGSLGILQTTNADGTITNGASASFQKYTGVYPNSGPGPGGCEFLAPGGIPTLSGLAVGTITLTGPNNLNVQLASTLGVKGAFSSVLPSDALPPTGGSFTFTSTGGADVGPFTATLAFTAPLFSWTNSAAVTTIDRSQGVDVTWTGGNPGSVVLISGGVTYNKTLISFTCTENALAGHFKVPAFITSSLPAGSGSIQLQNQFMVPVNASGLDGASAIGDISTASVKATFQ